MTIDTHIDRQIDTPYPLTADRIAFFRERGYIKLKQVFDAATLDYFGSAITRLTLALNTQTKPLAERSTYDRAFLQVMNLWEVDETARRFVFGRRLAGIAAALLEVDGVRLYHDQSLYKEPGGGFTPAHADQFYWPLESDRTVTAWVPLQPVPREMGPLAFYAGSQDVAIGRDLGISDDSERHIAAEMAGRGLVLDEGPFDLGEVSFHRGWTFHKAGPNLSDRPRSVMTVIYMDKDMRLKAPTNLSQQSDLDKWCPGAVPGEVVATPKNPVLFDRPG
ncbi:MAG: hypothetical protein RLY86_827 [Pseudomonadota bacterium]|jgi:ectoine hydroxylase-related dioxygenase (phytanoyl-CoA dioxygenase family)